MSSISSIGSMSGMAMMQGTQHRRPDPAQMAEDLFSKLDTSSQGYLEKADFQTAFDSISTSSDTDVDALFTQLDTDSDGKVTKDEFSSSLSKLVEQLDEQFQSMRMQEGMSGMGGMPPPPANDEGFTKEELTSQLEEIGETDSQRSSLISSVIENFEAADTDGDGKVTFKEAMALQQSSNGTSASAGTTSTDGTSASTDSDAQLMLQIMRLAQAYGLGAESDRSSSLLSVAA